jgi:ribonucleoside-diphosphate reductase alpha chain
VPSGRKRDKMTKIKNFNQSSDYFEEKPMSLIELNENSALIDNAYENFIAMSRYAKWVPDENRRETWKETVDRYFSFMLGHLEENFNYTPD